MTDQAETLREFVRTLPPEKFQAPKWPFFLTVEPSPGTEETFLMYRCKIEEGRPF